MADQIGIIYGDTIIDDHSFTTLQEQMLCEQFLEFLRKSDPQKLNQLRDAMDEINPNLDPTS